MSSGPVYAVSFIKKTKLIRYPYLKNSLDVPPCAASDFWTPDCQNANVHKPTMMPKTVLNKWIVMDKSYFRLRKDLVEPPQAPRLPRDIGLVPFNVDRHAAAARDLLEVAYRSGGGTVAPFARWWPEVEADPEYDPATIFIAADLKGGLVGIAFCWRVPFVKDLAVAPAWQRQGMGEALLRQAFVCFHKRGASHIDLKVQVDNPALRLYRRLGMRPV